MSISKEYWENPDNPDDNGHVHICNTCGEHGHTQEWADAHSCDLDTLREFKYWEDHYKDMPTDAELDEQYKELNP